MRMPDRHPPAHRVGPDELNESDAHLIWARAAQLQHGMADAVPDFAMPSSEATRPSFATDALTSARVVDAGLEAGLASEFVALSLAETEVLTREEREAIARVPAERAMQALRSDHDGIQHSVLVAAPEDQILASLGVLMTGRPWLLELDRVVQPLEGAPGVARWRVPTISAVAEAMESSGVLPALCYRAAVLGITRLHTLVVPRPEHGDHVFEVVFSADLRAARAVRVARMRREPAVIGTFAGVSTVGAAALFAGSAALGVPVLGGATALAVGLAAVTRPFSAWRYRVAVAKMQREVQDMANALADHVQRAFSAHSEQLIRSAIPDSSLRARLRR